MAWMNGWMNWDGFRGVIAYPISLLCEKREKQREEKIIIFKHTSHTVFLNYTHIIHSR